MLENAGIPFKARDSKLDERNIAGIDELNASAQAGRLALEKARLVSRECPGRVVVGADQTLDLSGRVLHKATSVGEAICQLRAMAGSTHRLTSAVCCVRDNEILFEILDAAEIRMRRLSEESLHAYARSMGDRILSTVGGYELEGLGVNLIESVIGDMFTVMGLPILQLLTKLRAIGMIGEEGEVECS
ncbi:MAG: Maf family protein [Hyphomicrobiales bacterium]|nr:Maf family protein [Rhodoblastus sp.]MCB9997790.1 Maf family protein [Methylobacteriaceae bacterium]MCC2103507.1 Maf family protein [Hyphomicrobiales bacterium]